MTNVPGHLKLYRVTAAEKEDTKKKERMEQRNSKKDPEQDEVDRTTWAKYTLGLKHQVSSQVILYEKVILISLLGSNRYLPKLSCKEIAETDVLYMSFLRSGKSVPVYYDRQ